MGTFQRLLALPKLEPATAAGSNVRGWHPGNGDQRRQFENSLGITLVTNGVVFQFQKQRDSRADSYPGGKSTQREIKPVGEAGTVGKISRVEWKHALTH